MKKATFSLNPEQQKAVHQTEGRLLILAGAGSGKTGTIVHRIAHMIQKGISPESILALTFTNKAANEMKERVAKLIEPAKAKKVFLSTFHSFCMFILRKEATHLGFTPHFSLYDERDMQRLLNTLAKENFPAQVLSIYDLYHLISNAKNKNAPLNDVLEEKDKKERKLISTLNQKLEASLRYYNALDFDSLLTLTVELFEKHPQILEKYQDRFRYIMIDEYQDTNPIQNRLTELLAAKYKNLCVVGDDDQSIYGWRGAEVEHILHFPADTLIKLEENYRSNPSILQAANAVISKNQKRHKKSLWTKKIQDQKITLFHAPTEVEEAQAVVDRIIALKTEKNIPFKGMAILYRSNALSLNLEIALMQTTWKKDNNWVRGVPYEVFGGMDFAERSEIKDLIAYLKVIANDRDQESLIRILNVPRRGIATQTLEALNEMQKKEKTPLYRLLCKLTQASTKNEAICDKAMKGIHSFISIMEEAKNRFNKSSLHESLKWLIQAINYSDAIKEEVKSEKAYQMKWENTQEMVNALAEFENQNPDGSLQDFISTTLLSKENLYEQKTSFNKDYVSLITFHSAKGLEFPACFIIGLEDHIVPHEKSLLETGIEEERRLFYVALTRAQDHLCLSMARSRKRSGKVTPTSPSRFLSEIPKEVLEISSYKKFPH